MRKPDRIPVAVIRQFNSTALKSLPGYAIISDVIGRGRNKIGRGWKKLSRRSKRTGRDWKKKIRRGWKKLSRVRIGRKSGRPTKDPAVVKPPTHKSLIKIAQAHRSAGQWDRAADIYLNLFRSEIGKFNDLRNALCCAVRATDSTTLDQILTDYLLGKVEDLDLPARIQSLIREYPPTRTLVLDRLCKILFNCMKQVVKTGSGDAFVDNAVSIGKACFSIDCLEQLRHLTGGLASLAPTQPPLLLLQAHVARWSGQLELARDLLQKALAQPDCDPAGYLDLAEVLDVLEDDAGAIAAVENSRKGFTEKEMHLKHSRFMTSEVGPLLRQRRLVEGWEARQKRRDAYALQMRIPEKIWDGSAPVDGKILVIGEGGIGDELKDATCYADLLSHFSRVVISCDPRLLPLLQRSFPQIDFIPVKRNETPGRWRHKSFSRDTFRINRAIDFELYCLMSAFQHVAMGASLPLFYRKRWDAFPDKNGFLIPDPCLRERWRDRLNRLGGGLKVGLSWRSASMNHIRNENYFTLEQLLPLLRIKGVQFVNLQYDSCDEELETLERKRGILVHRWEDTDLRDDLENVAALMKELDLVVTPYTMVKELSGAVGAPTLLLAPSTRASIRWRMSHETSQDIWHPSVIHVPSTRLGEKREVVALAQSMIEESVRDRGSASKVHQVSGRHSTTANKQESTRDETQVLTNEHGENYYLETAFRNAASRNAERNRCEQDFGKICGELFREVTQSENPKGVWLILGQTYRQYALTVLAAHGLLQRGWSFAYLENDPFQYSAPRSPEVAFFQGLYRGSSGGGDARAAGPRASEKLRRSWTINWKKSICKAEGINFYGVIVSHLQRELGQIRPDIEDREASNLFRKLLADCDFALDICFEVEARLSSLGLPVRLTCSPEHPVAGIFKIYCASRGRKYGIETIEILAAPEDITNSAQSDFVTGLLCQNVTRLNQNSASEIDHKHFDAWFKQSYDERAFSEARMSKPLTASTVTKPTQAQIITDRIAKHRSSGGRIACLYGERPFPTDTPGIDSGPAHEDIVDWCKHTMQILAESDTLLLIKLHPEDAREAREHVNSTTFLNLLREDPSPNVIIIAPHWLSDEDIARYCDFGIAWRCSTVTGLAAQGMPVVACASHSSAKRILNFAIPRNKSDYEDMLRNPERLALSAEQMLRASMVPEFNRDQANVDYRFGWIPFSETETAIPVLSAAAVRQYLRQGHPSIEEICKRIMA